MKKSSYIIQGLISAAGVFIYVSAVAWLFFNSQMLFGKPTSFLVPLFVLLLLVLSASITGLLVLGKPVHLYLNDLKKEAFTLLFTTLAWLLLFLVLFVITLLLR
jgi:hypothetical protein